MTDTVAGDLRTFGHIKEQDQETYDVVFAAALSLVGSEFLLEQATGKLLFVLLNAWERGELRYGHLPIMSAALDLATTEQLDAKWRDVELIEMVESVVAEVTEVADEAS